MAAAAAGTAAAAGMAAAGAAAVGTAAVGAADGTAAAGAAAGAAAAGAAAYWGGGGWDGGGWGGRLGRRLGSGLGLRRLGFSLVGLGRRAGGRRRRRLLRPGGGGCWVTRRVWSQPGGMAVISGRHLGERLPVGRRCSLRRRGSTAPFGHKGRETGGDRQVSVIPAVRSRIMNVRSSRFTERLFMERLLSLSIIVNFGAAPRLPRFAHIRCRNPASWSGRSVGESRRGAKRSSGRAASGRPSEGEMRSMISRTIVACVAALAIGAATLGRSSRRRPAAVWRGGGWRMARRRLGRRLARRRLGRRLARRRVARRSGWTALAASGMAATGTAASGTTAGGARRSRRASRGGAIGASAAGDGGWRYYGYGEPLLCRCARSTRRTAPGSATARSTSASKRARHARAFERGLA